MIPDAYEKEVGLMAAKRKSILVTRCPVVRGSGLPLILHQDLNQNILL